MVSLTIDGKSVQVEKGTTILEAAATVGIKIPTLCWLDASDNFLHFLCFGGTLLSLLLIAGFAPVLVLFLLWVFYLSLAVAGQDFLNFQWDALLLETGFLAIFFAPVQWLPNFRRESAQPTGQHLPSRR